MWIALRTTYYEPDLTGLIAQCMRPLVMDLRARYAPEAVLIWSHWKCGLHVNLACKLDASAQAQVEHYCARRIDDWLKRHPSTSTLDHSAYIKSCQRLGVLEGDTGPFEPLRANNQVEAWTYASRDISGSPALGVLWEQFLACSLDVILELASLRRTNTEAFYRALTALFATIGGFAGPGGLAHGHLSFRAHAEGLLAASPAVRTVFERAARALGPLVARALRDTLAPDYAPPQWLAVWRRSLEQINDDIGNIVIAENAFASEATYPRAMAGSDFLSALQSPAARALFTTAAHRRYRILVNLFYRILPTIGLSPLERARFAYVFAECCAQVLNVDWNSLLHEYQE